MATSTDPIALAHAAASAIEALCTCLDDCAREVEARGGQRTGRGALPAARAVAVADLENLMNAMPRKQWAAYARREVAEMLAGCVHGYVRPAWALRVVTLAQEVA